MLQNAAISATRSISEMKKGKKKKTTLWVGGWGCFPQNNSSGRAGQAADAGSGQELPCSRTCGSLLPPGTTPLPATRVLEPAACEPAREVSRPGSLEASWH